MSGQDHTGKNGAGGEFAKQATHWPTPDAAVSQDGEDPKTWELRSAEMKEKGYNGHFGAQAYGNGCGTPLAMAAKMWPSARQEDAESCGNHPGVTDSLTGVAKIWQTPATDSFRSRGLDRKDEQGLDQQARFWRTPDAPTTGSGVRTRTTSQGQGHQTVLAEQAADWPTPQSKDFRSGVTGNIAKQNARPLCEVACQSSLQAPTTPPPGQNSSAATRQLNPRFVEFLMNFPLGWTDRQPLAWTVYAHWETASSHSLRHLLTEYFANDSLCRPQPLQLTMFELFDSPPPGTVSYAVL